MKPKQGNKFKSLLHVRMNKLSGYLKSRFLRAPPWQGNSYRRTRKSRLWLTFLGILGLSLLSTGIWLFLWLRQTGVTHLDSSRLSAIIDYQHADNTLVFDRKGEKIGEFYSDYHLFLPFDKIPPLLVKAVLAVEDRHFFEHRGIDFRGILRALFVSLRSGSFTQGGSTITQQVVRNFLLTPEKTLERKIKEALLSLQLERHLSKERILEIYLNALFLGQGSYGVGAAAERHFGKPIDQLELHELALIAGLFQSPSRYNPHRAPEQAKRRQTQVLKAMVAARAISQSDYRKAIKRPLVYQSQGSLNAAFAPHFIDAIQEATEKLLTSEVKGKGLRIYTTLDLALQKDINQVISDATPHFQQVAQKLLIKNPDEKLIETAALILDQKNGEILAMIGGRDFARSQFNRALKAKRAPGSAFKPIVYAQALQNGSKWSDVSLVAPILIQDYRPQNSSGEYLSEVTLYNAFYRSVNTPAVELGQKVGLKNVIEMAKKLGIRTELKNQAGTLLGGSELTLLDMASLYASIANYGEAIEPRMITQITDRQGKVLYDAAETPQKREKALPPQIAYLMIDAMQAVFRYGTASPYAEWAGFAAGKTGTSNEARDNWFCGMTSRLTSVVWVGTDSNLSFNSAAGAHTIALPLWIRIMQKARQHYPSENFPVPEGIVKMPVHPHFGYRDEAGIAMPFIEGQEPIRYESAFSNVRDTGVYRDYLDR